MTHPGRQRPVRRWGLLLPVALLLVLPGRAGAAGPTTDAWFPSGLGLLTAAAYPARTLHVGAVAGFETDRSYLRFDGLPPVDRIEAAVLTLPVATDAGTFAAATALIRACRVPHALVEGATAPPTTDCDSAPDAVFVPSLAPSFTVDVLDLVTDGGSLTVGLVPHLGRAPLLPGLPPLGVDLVTWQVALDAHDRPGGHPPELVVTVRQDDGTATTVTSLPEVPLPPSPLPPAGPSLALPPLAGPSGAPAPTGSSAPTTVPTAVVPAASTHNDVGFLYPVVFALPIALLLAVGVLGDGLTRPVRSPGARS